ncbi:mannose-specific lectin [Fusarium sporotrichioides]|jgi:plastocyanin|uniref:Mannose-specific lectin n=1 Tax=Fusarium sporotrichioides TaxID=5514 RepID=A0A395RFS2_FUSSP|nr:mannose-specific lectin [Fusarium sporotrichioides]
MGQLANGDWLLTGNSIWSDDGETEFRMQKDGKVAVYHGDTCAWQNTPEQNWEVHGIKMQEDGNLVIYDNSGTGHAIWHTDTAAGKGNQSTTLVVQDDGNVVLYNEGGNAIWHTASNK